MYFKKNNNQKALRFGVNKNFLKKIIIFLGNKINL